MSNPGEIAAFGLISIVGIFLCLLQLPVRRFMGNNFFHQTVALQAQFLLRNLATFICQDK
ncbi:Uncharacterised protein [Klebsiella pneumoniae]|nr:Uncharacterised protein [Klebsiella pneumoniae]SLS04767.1 Uncharacterised protein [Klebsiella pneumoniae]SLS09230.1 Uncharacterised protein [Klebsiella pneumoniae]SLS85296.1 Uncharacterised protein [Klebsiella pneumoniae]SLT36068.1 Uncharacterised protein [Klebsiella pneumoniae]